MLCYVILLSSIYCSVFCQPQTWPGLFKRKHKPLPIDGSWTSWQEWKKCYVNTKNSSSFYAPWENFYIQFRRRMCNSPAPLYGGKECQGPSNRYRQCSCSNPLGLYTINMNQSAMSFSGKSLSTNQPNQAILSQNFDGWCSEEGFDYLENKYIQINFDSLVNVGAIATQGIKKGRISRYKLQYSLDGVSWLPLSERVNGENLFWGNLLPRKIKKNKFSSDRVLKLLRLYPVASYGLPCLKMEVFGCVFTCGSILTNSNGNVVGRSSVEIDQNCLWKIQVKKRTSLTFDFVVFNVLCQYGYLDFHDGDHPFNESPLLARKCIMDEEEELPLLKLNGNSVWINFISNSSSPEVDFNLKYFSECSQLIKVQEGEEIIVKSPNYPDRYFDNLNCTWEIILPRSSSTIDIFVESFDIENSEDSIGACDNDYVVIQYIRNGVIETYGTYCNKNPLARNISLSAEKIFISFKSNSYLSANGFYFKLLSKERSTLSTAYLHHTETVENKSFTSRNPFGTIKPLRNNTNATVMRRKIKKNRDDTWTIIIVSTFSAFCFILLCVIISINIRRFVNGRKELNAHCAKLIEQNRNKKVTNKRMTQKTLQARIHFKKDHQELPTAVNAQIQSSAETDKMLNKLDSEFSPPEEETRTEKGVTEKVPALKENNTHEASRLIIERTCSDGVTENSADAESYDSSSPQIHSPMRISFSEIQSDEVESVV